MYRQDNVVIDMRRDIEYVTKTPLAYIKAIHQNKPIIEPLRTTVNNQALIYRYLKNEFRKWKIIHCCYTLEHPLIDKPDDSERGICIITVQVTFKRGKQRTAHLVLFVGTTADSNITVMEKRPTKTKFNIKTDPHAY